MGAASSPAGLRLGPVEESPALRQARDANGALTRTRPTPAAAFHAARRMFLKGRRIDMRALAAELEISRPTLYRWTGQREQLLSDVAWSLSDEIFEQAKRKHPRHEGAKRLLAVYREHVGALVQAEPLHAFLRQETSVALRVLTSPAGGVQRRTVRRLAELYREEQEAGTFEPRVDPDSLAYAVVRLTEGFIYNDALATVEPAVDRAAEIVALLLE
jgi:Tetracyclin repressor-like, C-terminal domain